MAIAVDPLLVRDVLGPFGGGWTDAQITSRTIVVPALRTLEELCPEALSLTGGTDEEMVNIALASIVGAMLLRSAPQFASSSLGDSSFSMSADSYAGRVAYLETQARDLMAEVCPMPEVFRPPVMFRLAPGGRGI